jgi:hypothetical protein
LSGPQSDNSSGFVGGQSSFPGNGGGVLFEAVVPPAGIVPLDCFVCLFVCVCVCVCLKEKEGNGIRHTKQSGNKLLDDDIKRWDADGDGNDRVTVELRYVMCMCMKIRVLILTTSASIKTVPGGVLSLIGVTFTFPALPGLKLRQLHPIVAASLF